jgi:hypothetical protein
VLIEGKLDYSCGVHMYDGCEVTKMENINEEVAAALIKAYNDVKPCCLDSTRDISCGQKDVVCHRAHDTPSAPTADIN